MHRTCGEELYCTNPAASDASADPDNDGLGNLREWTAGTNPCDADSDDGGENDGSEVNRGADPRDPRDDGIRPPRIRAWADAGSVRVRFSSTRDYDHLRVLRAAPGGAWAEIAASVPPTGEWVDRSVTNGATYCYMVEAAAPIVGGAGKASDHPDPSCATPRLDPYAPAGSVPINDGAATAGSATIIIRLDASDLPEDEEFPSPAAPASPLAQVSGVAEVMIANEPTFAGAAWQPFSRTRNWTLTPHDGRAAVFVRYRDAAGNVSDTAVATIAVVGTENYLPLLVK